MARGSACCVLLLAACALLALSTLADARYLPTRGQDDRLDRLRELLKDLLEGEMERGVNPAAALEKRFFFKREVGAAEAADGLLPPPADGHAAAARPQPQQQRLAAPVH